MLNSWAARATEYHVLICFPFSFLNYSSLSPALPNDWQTVILLPLLNGHAHLALCHSTPAGRGGRDTCFWLREPPLPSFLLVHAPSAALPLKHWDVQTSQFIISPLRGLPTFFSCALRKKKYDCKSQLIGAIWITCQKHSDKYSSAKHRRGGGGVNHEIW